jgi:hypothetical protein
MNEESLRPKDINGNPIVLGDWYWGYDRANRLVGAGKITAMIGIGKMSFVIKHTSYSAENLIYDPIALQPDIDPTPASHLQDPWGNLIKDNMGMPMHIKPRTNCEPIDSGQSKKASRQILKGTAPAHLEQWEDIVGVLEQMRTALAFAETYMTEQTAEEYNKSHVIIEARKSVEDAISQLCNDRDRLRRDYAEAKDIQLLVAAMNAISVIIDGTLDSYDERNKARVGT